MKKNGFTIYETIVSIAIILMISLVIISACLLSNKSVLKSKSLNFGVLEIENVAKIFNKTSVEESGNLSFDELKTAINNFYQTDIDYTQDLTAGTLAFVLRYDKNFAPLKTGETAVEIGFKTDAGFLKMSGKVVLSNNVIYENDLVFEKAVIA